MSLNKKGMDSNESNKHNRVIFVNSTKFDRKGTIYLYFFTKDLNSITSGNLICIFRVGQCAADIGIHGKGSVDMQIAKVEVPLGIGC